MIADYKEAILSRKAGLILLAAILLSGAILRFTGLGAGLPLVYFGDGDETDMVNHAMQITWNDPNPHMFVWGSFPFYLLRIVAALSDGVFVIATGHALRYTDAYYIARGLSAVFSVGTILLVFYLGKRWGGWTGGLLSASVMALSSFAVVAAHYATSEPILGFWTTLSILAMMHTTSGRRYAIFAGAALGLAAATKYNAAVLVVPVGLIALRLEWPNRVQSLSSVRLLGFAAFALAAALAVLITFLLQDRLLASAAAYAAGGELQPFYVNLFRRLLIGGFIGSALAATVVLAAWLQWQPAMFMVRVSTNRTLVTTLAVAAIVFLIVSPYAILDFPAFCQGVAYSIRKQGEGAIAGLDYGSRSYLAAKGEGASIDVLYSFRVIVDEFGLLGAGCIILGLYAVWRRARGDFLPVAGLILATFAMLVGSHYSGTRYLYPIWGLLAVLAGLGMATACRYFSQRMGAFLRPSLITVLLASLLVVPMSIQACRSVQREFLAPDTRASALEWMRGRFEPGTLVVRERYTMNLEFAQLGYQVQVTDALFEHKKLADWEREGVRVMLVGEVRHRFYEEHADSFKDVLQEYEELRAKAKDVCFRPAEGGKGPVIHVYELP